MFRLFHANSWTDNTTYHSFAINLRHSHVWDYSERVWFNNVPTSPSRTHKPWAENESVYCSNCLCSIGDVIKWKSHSLEHRTGITNKINQSIHPKILCYENSPQETRCLFITPWFIGKKEWCKCWVISQWEVKPEPTFVWSSLLTTNNTHLRINSQTFITQQLPHRP